ncbi:MAG: hypothetical protein M3394_07720 [Actinomycetota bacterium]|nr:hypothetical protein [Actinomycetota bacterium]
MAQNDMLKRYLDAGIAFTKMSRSRAEGIVNDLVKAGEIQRDQAQQRVDDLVDRSRRNTEALVDIVRRELREQLSSLGVATKADLARIESRIESLTRSAGSGGPAKAAAPSAPAKKAPAAKAPAKAASAGKATAKKATPAKAAKKG